MEYLQRFFSGTNLLSNNNIDLRKNINLTPLKKITDINPQLYL